MPIGTGAILTHRGLDPARADFPWHESTLEAFRNQLDRGFGIEFDIQPLKTGELLVSHEASLEALSGGANTRPFPELTKDDATRQFPRGRLGLFEEVLGLLETSPASISALHLKGRFQNESILSSVVAQLRRHPALLARILIFDLTAESGVIMRNALSDIHLAPSVAHPYDIERYNRVVEGTLMSAEAASRLTGIFDWVWLDEWDRADRGGGQKALYTPDCFAELRSLKMKIAVVSPELHSTSPGLLGGEAHPDGRRPEELRKRMAEIMALNPDAICTDYPDLARSLIGHS